MSRKITPDDAAAIRASAEHASVLAARFGLAESHVYNVKAGRVHNPPEPPAGEWRVIAGFSGAYRISSTGQVWSALNGRLRRQRTTDWGYFEVTLCRQGQRPKNFRVHRLVAEAFVENPAAKPEVNHIDGDKQNNAATNLEWVTKKENAAHAVAAGAYKRRKLRTYNKLAPDQPKPCVICGTIMVRRATRIHRSRETTTAFAKRQCCSKACVGRLRSMRMTQGPQARSIKAKV